MGLEARAYYASYSSCNGWNFRIVCPDNAEHTVWLRGGEARRLSSRLIPVITPDRVSFDYDCYSYTYHGDKADRIWREAGMPGADLCR